MEEEIYKEILAGVRIFPQSFFLWASPLTGLTWGVGYTFQKQSFQCDRENKLPAPIHGWNVNELNAFSPFLYYTEFDLMTFW